MLGVGRVRIATILQLQSDVLEEVHISVTFVPEVDLSYDATGRSRYEWFYSV